MKPRHIAALALSLSSPALPQSPVTLPFECRSSTPVMPSLPIIKTEEDRRISFREWWFDPSGQTVFGLPAKFLSHLRSHDAEYSIESYHYTAIVDGEINHVRWLVEKASPDIRCIPNGKSFTCLLAARYGTTDGGAGDRNISIFRAHGDADHDNISEGVVVSCSWDKSYD